MNRDTLDISLNENDIRKIISFMIFNVVIFQKFISSYFDPIRYFDEILFVAAFFYILFKLIADYDFDNILVKMILTMLIIISLGLLANFVFGIQNSMKCIALDMVSCSKTFFIFVACYIYINDNLGLYDFCLLEAKCFTVLAFIFLIVMHLGFQSMSFSSRYGIPTYVFIFSNPTYLVAFMVTMMIFLISSEYRYKNIFITMALIVIFSSLRTKAFGFIVAYLGLNFMRSKKIDLSKISKFIIIIFAMISISFYSIKLYYLSDSPTARSLLTHISTVIGDRFFPLGTGFATYGSFASSLNYSPLYIEYNLHSIYGLSEANPVYLFDTFWPTLVAQFGWIGLIFWLLLIYYWVSALFNKVSCETQWLSCSTGLIYLLIASSSETAIFSNWSIGLFMAMLIALNKK